MPNYKVINADQLDEDLTIVADAIRSKAGISDKLPFPYGLKSAVEAIESGGVQEDLDAAFAEQDALIKEIKTALYGKAAGGTVETWTFTMEDGTEIEKQVVIT